MLCREITVLKNYLPEFKFFNNSKCPTLAQSFEHAAQKVVVDRYNAKTLENMK